MANEGGVAPQKNILAALMFCSMITGCTSSLHGSYAPISYVSDDTVRRPEPLGQVRGESCQTKLLYFFPMGSGVSTSEAIRAAKEQLEGTSYIAEISIDDRMNWGLGYSEQCITVDAIAY